MEEIDINIELMGLQYYIEAMKKHETSKTKLEDLDNLMIHVSNLKEWVRIKESTDGSNWNKPHVIKSVCTHLQYCVFKDNDNTCKSELGCAHQKQTVL